MSRAGRFLETALLALLGGHMAWLALSGNSWHLLNPKFSWLLAAGGIGLLVTAGAAVLVPRRSTSPSRVAVLVLVLALAALAHPWETSTGKKEFGVTSPLPVEDAESADGKYVRINLLELFRLVERNNPREMAKRYMVRGMVALDPSLEAQGQFLIVRTAVWCCLADAVAAGFRVSSPDTAGLRDGQWVRVAGSLRRLPAAASSAGAVAQTGPFYTNVNKEYVLVPDTVDPISPPDIPFMFSANTEEPYYY